jgi:glycyl-tRNA synthetase beta chain
MTAASVGDARGGDARVGGAAGGEAAVGEARSLLIEIGTEELPPIGLPGLSKALTESIVQGLAGAGIAHGEVRSFATPRRLGVLIAACRVQAPDRSIERRGPPVASSFDAEGAPTQAARAFANSCGVEVAALTRLTTDKGAWLSFHGTERGAATTIAIGPILNQAIAALPIAKRMRWGARKTEFVRPVHWIVLLFGDEVIPVEVLGLRADRITRGHRFHAPQPIVLGSAQSYEARLRRAKVVASFAQRRESIRSGVTALAAQLGGKALIEDALLDEVTALVEWPVPLAGRYEERFLRLPREVVIATIQDHQRYFPVEAAEGALAGWFITVSNIASRDPDKVRAGNERVVRPRLSDAAFFWEQDRKLRLEEHAANLGGVTFQTKLGSYADKTRRVRALATEIGELIGAGPDVDRAAQLAKADLMTSMVGEFPELQGTMGRYYAAAQGENAAVCIAIEDQYRPRYSGDELPRAKTGQALALADKLDTLLGIFVIDQKPTGAKDPFGLRRAALGILRILLEGGLDLDLYELAVQSAAAQPVHRAAATDEVFAFLMERLRGLLLERGDGTTTEMVDAVLGVGARSPVDIDTRLQALRDFSSLPDAPILAAANKRIANILKKAELDPAIAVESERFSEAAEHGLYRALLEVRAPVEDAMRRRAYGETLRLLAGMRGSIDTFFAEVMVMDENAERRNNRLALLREVRRAFSAVADLSRLPG